MKQKKLVSSAPVLRTSDNNLSKKWYWEWYDDRGKRQKRCGRINRGATVEERLALAEIERVRIATGLGVKPSPVYSVMYQHLKPHLDVHCQTLRQASVRDYTTVLDRFESWVVKNGFRKAHPKSFTRQQAEMFARFLEVEENKKNATYNKYLNVLDMLFGYLVQHDVIQKSPFQYIKRKRKESVSVAAFKEADVARLKGIIKEANITVYIACMVDMYAFIRPNEIRMLRIANIDLNGRLITVPAEISKNKRTASVAIVEPLSHILLEYIGQDAAQDDYLLSKEGKPGPVPIAKAYVVKQHNKIMQRNGYDHTRFKPYSWKHTGNSIAYKKGASLKFLKMQNRHHAEVMTEIYIKSIVPEDLLPTEEQYFDF